MYDAAWYHQWGWDYNVAVEGYSLQSGVQEKWGWMGGGGGGGNRTTKEETI